MAGNSEPTIFAPKEYPRLVPADTHKHVEERSADLTFASQYIQQFYASADKVHTHTVMACHRAVTSFFVTTSMPKNRSMKPALLYQLIRVALGVLPATAAATRVFEALAKGLTLAKDAQRIKDFANLIKTTAATAAQRGAALAYAAYTIENSHHAKTLSALDQLSKWATQGAEEIERQKNQTLDSLEPAKARLPGALKTYFVSALGAKPEFVAAHIDKIQNRYEMNLYKEFYGQKARVYLWEDEPWEVDGVPSGVLDRLKTLTGMPTAYSALLSAGFVPPVYHCRRDTKPLRSQQQPRPVRYRPDDNWRAGQKW